MAKPRLTPTGKWELTVTNKLLPKRLYFTFDTEEEATNYGRQVSALLDKGVIPTGLIPDPKTTRETVGPVIRAWLNSGLASQSDQDVLGLVFDEVGKVLLKDMTYKWAEAWVRALKVERNLSPGTIRKRVGALRRAISAFARQNPDAGVLNPLALLPDGYASYSPVDKAEALANDKKVKVDQVRDRRLADGEEQKIIAALSGVKRDDRERALALPDGRAMLIMFLLILNSGARLIEAYGLTRGQILLPKRVLRLKTSKQRNGKVVFRDVPIRPELMGPLTDYLAERELTNSMDLVFPCWDGDVASLRQCGHRLSQRFASVFDYAGCEGLTEHDLRHEATCRWFELCMPNGQWMFRSEEINRLMGWAPNSTMAQRYASFRGEDLATRMWPAGEPALGRVK